MGKRSVKRAELITMPMLMKLFIAIPALNESAYLPATLQAVEAQTLRPAGVFVCVNQPDAWWTGTEEQQAVCRDNQKTIAWLRDYHALNLSVIDRSSPGLGWQGKQSGAGWARKAALDAVNQAADSGDIMVSMDADTFYPRDYLQAVHAAFADAPGAVALSAPFYHHLGDVVDENRALLRYELYMRHYFLHLVRIASPYAFIALGSAISLPVRAYRTIRGITPFKAGEDFYFLQKLRKTGNVLVYCDASVYPSSRFSARAGFGTGPAIGRGVQGNWSAYPFFPEASFDAVLETYRLFPDLYDSDLPTPMDAFFEKQFGNSPIWPPLRKNFRTREHFVRACHEKIDGLRLLQFLKFHRSQAHDNRPGETVLADFMNRYLPDGPRPGLPFSFDSSPIGELDALRARIYRYELEVRKNLP